MQRRFLFICNRLECIFILYAASLFASASIYALSEGKSFWDGLWWSVVTGLTIGYGDQFPITVLGRLSAIVFAHFWIFGIIPMVIAHILMNMIEDRDAFTHDEQEWNEDALKKIAAALNVELKQAPRDY